MPCGISYFPYFQHNPEMRSVLDSIRNARTQLNYDIANMNLEELDEEDVKNKRPSHNLRNSYVQMLQQCDQLVEVNLT